MGEDRHARLVLHARDQGLAAARHDDVDIAAKPAQHLADGGAVGGRDDLDGVGGQAGAAAGPRPGRHGWRATSATLSEPPRRITALPDFRQSAPASAVTLGRLSKITPMTPSGVRTRAMTQAVGPRPFGHHAADRIGQVGDGAQPVDDAVDALVGEQQPVEEGRRNALARRRPRMSSALAARMASRWRVERVGGGRSARACLRSAVGEGQHAGGGAGACGRSRPSVAGEIVCTSLRARSCRLGLQAHQHHHVVTMDQFGAAADARAVRRRAAEFLPLTRSASSRPSPARPRAISRPSGSRMATASPRSKSPVTRVTPMGSRLLPVEQRPGGAGIDMHGARDVRACP